MSRRPPATGGRGLRLLRAWAPALLWAGGIFWFSSRPTVPLPSVAYSDKLAHFAAYAGFGLVLARGEAALRGRAGALTLALGLLYAASDEYHQSFVPGRSVELADWGADALGVAAGLGAWHLLHRRARRAPPLRSASDSATA